MERIEERLLEERIEERLLEKGRRLVERNREFDYYK